VSFSTEDRIKALEAIAADESIKPTQRLRAMEELGRIETRMRLAQGERDRPAGDDDSPYPMEDLWEVEVERRERARSRERRRVARSA
jgi:hypothetical protein